MKKISAFLLISIIAFHSSAQDKVGIGTTSPEGKLHIKNTDPIPQLVIEKAAAANNAVPLLKMKSPNGDLLWMQSDTALNLFIGVGAGLMNSLPGDGIRNTFLGFSAGRGNTVGQNNTAVGAYTLYKNDFGDKNTAIGYNTLYNNTGHGNTAVGSDAMPYSGFTSSNTAIGSNALNENLTGSNNTATGMYSLGKNSSGSSNVAMGYVAMNDNSTGAFNTGIGVGALQKTTGSQFNTAIGYGAGDSFDNGYNNVFVGAETDVNAAGYFNVIAIGRGTPVTASSTARFGNASTVSYGGWAGWSNVSDGRFKKNIKENVPGLAFINRLKPVTYNIAATALDAYLHRNNKMTMDAAATSFYNIALQEKEAITYSGFIAQDVEATATSLGFDFSGVDKPKNNNDTYGLRYAEFVVPLVKAVQEQQEMIIDLKKENKEIKEELQAMKKMLQQLSERLN